MFATPAFAQVPGAAGGGPQDMLIQFLPLIGLVVLFYFLMIRPQQRRMKQHQQMIANLKSRVFLMRNINNKGGPILFSARWAMSYMAGPFTRQQISTLMAGKKTLTPPSPLPHGEGGQAAATAASAPALPSGFTQQPPVTRGGEQFFRFWRQRF